MGLFSSSRQASGEQLYEEVKGKLVPKDDLKHVIMITSFSKFFNQNFDVETKYTEQINPILTGMQKDGYEILDVKFNTMSNEGLTGDSTQFQTMIIYK